MTGYARIAGALVLAGACSLAAIAPASAPAVARLSADDTPVATSPLAPVDIVIAADESASIKSPHSSEMTLEQDAARLIALGEFSPASKIGVLGFGGPNEFYNAQTNRQMPVDPVCPMTEVDTPASRQKLSDCIGKLQVRKPRQGNRTDFIDAIEQGVLDLTDTRDTGRPLLLFLLTDGVLDMVGSPNFTGKTNKEINDKAERYLLTQTLPLARGAGVRIWPFGFGQNFGNKVDVGELREIAAGGAQGSCNTRLRDATPHAITVTSASQIKQQLPQIFADARCLGTSTGTSASIGSGSSTDLYVTVPDVVTSGSIEVIRQSTQISVTYFDPDKRQVPVPDGSLAGQKFSLGGANGPVESLLVGNPVPGRWRVHVAAGRGVPSGQLVTAIVLWQGVLHSDIVTDPTNPSPGQAVTVTVKLQVGPRPLSARDLAGVHVSVKVAGTGLAAPISVPVNDDGLPPDQGAHDAVYDGTFTVPRSASGTLTVEGIVSAQGVMGDARSTSITVNSSALAVTGRMTLSGGEVAQGGQVTGTLRLSNPEGKPHTIRLIPQDTPPGVTVTPPTISLPATPGTTPYQFTVNFADAVPTGAVTGHVSAVDAATGSAYAQAAITTKVVAPRTVGPPQKTGNRSWLSVVFALIALSVVVAALVLWLLAAWLRPRSN